MNLEQLKSALSKCEQLDADHRSSGKPNPDLWVSAINDINRAIENFSEYPVHVPLEGEKILIRVNDVNLPMPLTEKEKAALEAFLDDDYASGDWDASSWSWSVAGTISWKLGITSHAAAGVIGSLCKKKLMRAESGGKDASVGLTVYGREWLRMYRPENASVKYCMGVSPDWNDILAWARGMEFINAAGMA